MRLPSIKPQEVIRILKQIGFTKARQTGSHFILVDKENRNIIVVPVHANKDIKKGTLRSIIK